MNASTEFSPKPPESEGGQHGPSLAVSTEAIEIHPLVSDDQYRFLAGDLSAEEYLSRGDVHIGQDRTHEVTIADKPALGILRLLAGASYIVMSVLLLVANGSSAALVGLVVSMVTMVGAQVAFDLRERSHRRHRLNHDLS